jgi:hypothetical protein
MNTHLAILAMAETRSRIIGRVEVHFVFDLATVTRACMDHGCEISFQIELSAFWISKGVGK